MTWTTDHLISRWPAVPPELQPPQSSTSQSLGHTHPLVFAQAFDWFCKFGKLNCIKWKASTCHQESSPKRVMQKDTVTEENLTICICFTLNVWPHIHTHQVFFWSFWLSSNLRYVSFYTSLIHHCHCSQFSDFKGYSVLSYYACCVSLFFQLEFSPWLFLFLSLQSV